MKEVNKANWEEEVVKSNIPVIIDFWAAWCGPCEFLSSILEELEEELSGKAKFVSVDVEKETELANTNGIKAVPTLLIFIDGVEKDRMLGYKNKNALLKKWREFFPND